MSYRIVYADETSEHLQVLTARQRSIVFDSVDRQLSHQPNVETRNRKPMRENPLGSWELRIGNLRVYYHVEEDPEPIINILAVGIKRRNEIWVGGRKIEL